MEMISRLQFSFSEESLHAVKKIIGEREATRKEH